MIKQRQVWGTKSTFGEDLVFDLGNVRVSSACSLENPGSPCLGSCVVQSLSCVQLFVTPWAAARQASLSFTISWGLLKFMSIESMMPSNHLVLCRPFLLPSVFPSIRVFSNELALRIKWPKYWNFSFSISPSSEYSGLISPRIDWFDFLAVQGTLKTSAPQFESLGGYSIWTLVPLLLCILNPFLVPFPRRLLTPSFFTPHFGCIFY